MMRDKKLLGKNWQERKRNIPKFLELMKKRPDLEAKYMKNIRSIAKLNLKAMNDLYINLDSYNNAPSYAVKLSASS